MAQCVTIVDKVITSQSNDLVACSDFVVMTAADYHLYQNDSFYQLLVTLFEFDASISGMVTGASLLMFLISHGGGNVVRWLGK